MTKKEIIEQEAKQEAEYLEKLLKPGDTVFTVLRHVSQSGMSRDISVIAIVDSKPLDISHRVATLLKYNRAKDGSIKIGGCGMDMGFAIIYALSHRLYLAGFKCIGKAKDGKHRTKGCPASDHSNGDRNYKPHIHKDGGYALRHAWL